MYTVPQKVVHRGDNCVNSLRIFKILSLLEKEVNFQQNPYNTSHHTFSECVAALRCESYKFEFWHIWKKMQTNM